MDNYTCISCAVDMLRLSQAGGVDDKSNIYLVTLYVCPECGRVEGDPASIVYIEQEAAR